MTSAVQQRPTRPRSEEAAISSVIDRLAAQFPEFARDEIARAVNERHAGFQGSRVRDFVPVLVERAVRQEIVASQRA